MGAITTRGGGCWRLLALGIVALCGAVALQASSSVSALAAPHGPAQSKLPVAAYQITTKQQAELTYLTAVLEKKCMARLGYHIDRALTVNYISDMIRIDQEFSSREWGISTLAVARRYGYALPPWVQGPGKPDTYSSANEGYAMSGTSTSGRSPDASQKQRGVPAGGCVGWASRALAKNGLSVASSHLSRLVGNISLRSFYEARASSIVKRAFARWSVCMARHGYHYATPFDHPPDSASSGPTRQVAIETAVTDIGCKRSTRFLTIVYSVQAKYQRTLIEQHAQTLANERTEVKKEGRALLKLAAKYGIS